MIFLIFHIEKHIVVASIPDIFLFKKVYLTCQIHDFNVFLVYLFSLHFFLEKKLFFYSFVIYFFIFLLCIYFLKKFILHRLKKWCLVVPIATLFNFSVTLKISLRFYLFLLIHIIFIIFYYI
jgi:hypothetical protein